MSAARNELSVRRTCVYVVCAFFVLTSSGSWNSGSRWGEIASLIKWRLTSLFRATLDFEILGPRLNWFRCRVMKARNKLLLETSLHHLSFLFLSHKEFEPYQVYKYEMPIVLLKNTLNSEDWEKSALFQSIGRCSNLSGNLWIPCQ